MKKINSIWYGATILKWGIVFAAVIPLILYAAAKLFRQGVFLNYTIKASIALGALILLIFTIMLFIELRQDKKINKFYSANKDIKIRISDDYYECQNCGYKRVRKNEKTCTVCGMNFSE